MKECTVSYDSKKNIVYVDAYKSDFVPAYLYYLLEYLKMTSNPVESYRIMFTKDGDKLWMFSTKDTLSPV